MRIAYVNGEYLPMAEAKISVLDRGFNFADGIYEISAVVGGQLIDNPAHLQRLKKSLGEISLVMNVSFSDLEAIMAELVERNSVDEGLVYIQVTRGVAERDFAFPKDTPTTLVVFTQKKNLIDNPKAKTGIEVITYPEIRWSRCDIKSVALLGPVLAKQAAAEAGVGEAVFVDNGNIVEGASSSVFIVSKGGEIITRPKSHSILPGITRKTVLAIVAEQGLKFVERTITVEEFKSAAEAFITSASTFVMPVVDLDGVQIGDGAPGPVTNRLRERYIEFARSGS